MSNHPDPLAFLGEEFLTWLWLRIENQGGDFELDGEGIGVSFDDFIAFAPRDDDETEFTLRHGLPSRSREAASALRGGRRLNRARLILGSGEQVWSFVLDGPTMQLLSVKLPEDDPDTTDAEERNLDRIKGFVTLRKYVVTLYRIFIEERLTPSYGDGFDASLDTMHGGVATLSEPA